MKKLFKGIISTALCLMVLTPTFAHASDLNEEASTPQVKWQQKVEEKKQNIQDRREEKRADREERKEVKEERRADFMEMVETYAPELAEQFDDKFTEHHTLQSSIFEARLDKNQSSFNDAKEELNALKEELQEQVKNEEITKEELKETLKAFRDENKAEREAIKEGYKSDLADEIEAQKTRHEETKALREALKTAVENEDSETIVSIINQLYDNLLEHIEFDSTKLEYIENMS